MKYKFLLFVFIICYSGKTNGQSPVTKESIINCSMEIVNRVIKNKKILLYEPVLNTVVIDTRYTDLTYVENPTFAGLQYGKYIIDTSVLNQLTSNFQDANISFFEMNADFQPFRENYIAGNYQIDRDTCVGNCKSVHIEIGRAMEGWENSQIIQMISDKKINAAYYSKFTSKSLSIPVSIFTSGVPNSEQVKIENTVFIFKFSNKDRKFVFEKIVPL